MPRNSKLLVFLLFLNISFAHAQGITPVGGGGGGSGTVTSIATTCGVSGGTITTTGTISGNATPNAQTGTTYAILDGDCGKLVTLSNGSAVAVSIAQAGTASSFASGWFTTIKNLGAGTVTITPTTSTIDGVANLALTTNQSIDLYSDGTNYITGRGIGGSTTDASLLTSGTLAAGRMPALTGDCVSSVGTVATTCNSPHPGYIASNYYFPLGFSTTAAGSVTGANVIACMYGVVPRTVTVGTLFLRVNTAGSSNTQMAIYTNSSGVPGALIAATGSVANTASTTNISAALSANKQIGPSGADGGREIWFCANQNDSTVVYASPTGSIGAGYIGHTTLANIIQSGPIYPQGKTCAGANCQGGSSTFGTWPASLATSTWTYAGGPVPAIGFQVVSSP